MDVECPHESASEAKGARLASANAGSGGGTKRGREETMISLADTIQCVIYRRRMESGTARLSTRRAEALRRVGTRHGTDPGYLSALTRGWSSILHEVGLHFARWPLSNYPS